MGFQCSRVCTESTSSDNNVAAGRRRIQQSHQQSTVFVWVFGASGFARRLRRLTANLRSVDADVKQSHKQSTVFVWVFGATGFARHLRRVTAISTFVLFYYAFSYVCETP